MIDAGPNANGRSRQYFPEGKTKESNTRALQEEKNRRRK
jgi:hypothetical protein